MNIENVEVENKAAIKAAEGTQIRRSHYTSQNQMVDFWDEKFKEMIKDLKDEITEVLEES